MKTGRCHCGEVRYEINAEPVGLYICHCLECRKQSASAFGITLELRRAGFHLTQGPPKFWSRPIDNGGQLNCTFCENCGSRLWHEASATSETVSKRRFLG